MSIELRLFEDTPFSSTEIHMAAGVARAIYVSAGRVTVNGADLPTDEGMVSTDSLSIQVGDERATLWRWEVAPSTAPKELFGGGGALRLAATIDGAQISDSLLMRLDSVAFPPSGCAFLHTHQGPGIHCLREGNIRILRSWRRLVRSRPGTGLRAGGYGTAQPLYPGDGFAASAHGRLVNSLRQRGRSGEAQVANLSGLGGSPHRTSLAVSPHRRSTTNS
jgi:hypothetical protein